MIESIKGKWDIKIGETEHLEFEARLAVSMIERWGMVAATPDGEDSSGRAKLRVSTPNELVERAFKTAELAMKYARKHGLVHTSPSIHELDPNMMG